MSTQINGDAALVNRPAPVAIASTTVATPIVVTTAAPHLLSDDDTVMLRAVVNNASANGLYVVSVVDATHVRLVGSVGSGSGGSESGATIQSLGFDATFPIPADLVDLMAAASVGVPFEAVADRTCRLALASRSGWQLIDEGQVTHDDPGMGSTPSAWSTNAIGTAGWREVANTPEIPLYGAETGDFVEIEFQASAALNTDTDSAAIGILWVDASIVNGKMSASGRTIQSGTAGGYVDASLRCFVPVPASPSKNGSVVIGWFREVSAPTLALIGDYTFRARLWRSIP